MAAGQDLEPYWEVYRQHFRGHVINWMEKYVKSRTCMIAFICSHYFASTGIVSATSLQKMPKSLGTLNLEICKLLPALKPATFVKLETC
jgi:hypothetical protein